VLPLAVGVAAQRAGSPDGDAAAQVADAVDAVRVQAILVRLAQAHLEAQGAADHLVGRRLVYAAHGVDPGIDAGEVAARGHEVGAFAHRVEDLDAGEVE